MSDGAVHTIEQYVDLENLPPEARVLVERLGRVTLTLEGELASEYVWLLLAQLVVMSDGEFEAWLGVCKGVGEMVRREEKVRMEREAASG